MALRLFRTTGYSTLLMPGEARLATHPLQMVLWASLWLAVPCNVGVWRALAGEGHWREALACVGIIAGGCGVLFNLLGWRRTLKPAITLVLFAGAIAACGLWSQQLPVETLWQGPLRSVLPAWASFLRWQVLALLVLLALVPMVWMWNHPLRRLPGPAQLRSNLLGACIAAAVLAASLLHP